MNKQTTISINLDFEGFPEVQIAAYDDYLNAQFQQNQKVQLQALRQDKLGILVCAPPKAGSDAILHILRQMTGCYYARLCASYRRTEQDLYLPYLYMFRQYDFITQLHMVQTIPNLNLIQLFNLKPILLTRNIYDIVIGIYDQWMKDPYRATDCTQGLAFMWTDLHSLQLSRTEKIDFIIDNVMPWIIKFYVSWEHFYKMSVLQPFLIEYETCQNHPVSSLKKIMDYLEINQKSLKYPLEELVKQNIWQAEKHLEGKGEKSLSDEQKLKICHFTRYYPKIDFTRYGFNKSDLSKVSIQEKNSKSNTQTNKDTNKKIDELKDIAILAHKNLELLDAERNYRAILELDPQSLFALKQLALINYHRGEWMEALQYYAKVLEEEPNDPVIFNNMGATYILLGNYDNAILCFLDAIELNQNYSSAYNNLGNCYKRSGQSELAIEAYANAVRCDPMDAAPLEALNTMLRQSCAWERYTELENKLDVILEKELQKKAAVVESPLSHIMRSDDVHKNYLVAKSNSDRISLLIGAPKEKYSFTHRKNNPPKKITLGYLSIDFCDHPVAYLIKGLLKAHNRDKFHVIAYSYGNNDSSMARAQINEAVDEFVDIKMMSHNEAADLIYKKNTDILIDLTGHTAGKRLEILALRPAPIQIGYLGFVGTSGADFIDYIITDKIVTPPEMAPDYSEKFIYMPHCFQVNDDHQIIENKVYTREECGLPPNKPVLCSFNQPVKLDPIFFKVWCQILKAVPESVLWFFAKTTLVAENLQSAAEANGVDPSRLIFLNRCPKESFLAKVRLADLALDTRLYNGGTVTTDLLWAGVPVLTLQGKHFASRMASSILTALGIPELITHSVEEYESLAIELLRNTELRTSLRQKIDAHKKSEKLFATNEFTRDLEVRYEAAFHRFLKSEPPEIID